MIVNHGEFLRYRYDQPLLAFDRKRVGSVGDGDHRPRQGFEEEQEQGSREGKQRQARGAGEE